MSAYNILVEIHEGNLAAPELEELAILISEGYEEKSKGNA